MVVTVDCGGARVEPLIESGGLAKIENKSSAFKRFIKNSSDNSLFPNNYFCFIKKNILVPSLSTSPPEVLDTNTHIFL